VVVGDVEGAHAAIHAIVEVAIPLGEVDVELAILIAHDVHVGLVVPLGGVDGRQASLKAQIEEASVEVEGYRLQPVRVPDGVAEHPEAARQVGRLRQREVVNV